MKNIITLLLVFFFCFSTTALSQHTARTNFTKRFAEVNAIIPDFQVNENAGPNGAYQQFSYITTDGIGNSVIIWQDHRDGDYDIYAQRYAGDGSALGTNFKVVDLEFVQHGDFSISADSSGNFVITWMDWEDTDIYAQRYSSDGTALGSNFKVNDDLGSELQRKCFVSADERGNFVIAWSDDWRNGEQDIYAQRYSSDGSPLGTNFKVNDAVGMVGGYGGPPPPSISTDASGNFVITWCDGRNGDADIYAQRYFSDGTALGSNFKVNDVYGIPFCWFVGPSISTVSSGNFVITWTDERNGDTDIYAQRYSSDGTALGSNFKVNDDLGSELQRKCFVSADESGNFVITWCDGRNGDADIYAQRYSSDGSPLGTNFKVNDDQGDGGSPAISTDGSGNFVITWTDGRNGDGDIYAQRYSSDGTALGINFRVNDDQGSAYQEYSSMSTDSSGNFVITWRDERNGNYDIYAQRYLSDGTALGSNFKVNDYQGSYYQVVPAISTDGSGNFVITWEDWRNDYGDIYAQRYSNDGNPLGTNFKVNDDQGSAYQSNSSISTDGSGNFMITWEDFRDGGDFDIYAQRYSSNGTALGSNFKVNDYRGTYSPSISADSSGNFVITWGGRDSYGMSDIKAQRYSSDGTALGSNFRVNDDQGSNRQVSPSISIDGSGHFVIAWVDDRNFQTHLDTTDIYAQRYSSDGTALGSNFKVNDDQGSSFYWDGGPSSSTDVSGNFVITWADWRNGNRDIYAQRYTSDGSTLGSNFIVINTSEEDQFDPDVKLWNGRIYNTWTDNRTGGTGYDIWANVLDWNNPVGVEDKETLEIPSAFSLSQNYPNPFNPSTTIRYSIPQSSNVVIKVFDVLGNEIETLVNEEKSTGTYELTLYAWSLPSGVYFYRLQTGSFVEIKKMLLLK